MNRTITTADNRARTTLALILMAVAGTVGFLLADSPAHSATAKTVKGRRPARSRWKTALGMILVNSKGRTLYLFAKDRSGKSSCSGSCATFWPAARQRREANRRLRREGGAARPDTARER